MAVNKPPITVKSVQDKATKNIPHITKNIGNLATNPNKKGRKIIEDHTRSTTDLYKKFFGGISKIPNGNDAHFQQWLQITDRILGAQELEVSTGRLRELFNDFKDDYYNLTGKAVSKSSQSHIDFNVVGQRALAVHFELGNIEIALNSAKAVKNAEQAGTDITILADLQNYKLAFSRLGQICKGIMTMPKSNFMTKSGNRLNRGLQTARDAADHFNRTENQQSWLVTKDKQVDVLAGKAEQRLDLVPQQLAEATDAEYAVGALMRMLWKDQSFNLSAMNKKLNMAENDWANISGSKTLKSQIEKGLTDALLGKRSTYKSNTKTRAKSKSRGTKLKGEQDLKKLKSDLSNTKIIGLQAAKKAIESGGHREQDDVIKLKRLINKRLGAEVRRNMGRPALINRTGRFSNSAQVTRLKETAGGIRAEYTYLLNPYQTFENTGSRRWPIGYNPKALITKSIRQLAIQYTETKFTQLRRL